MHNSCSFRNLTTHTWVPMPDWLHNHYSTLIRSSPVAPLFGQPRSSRCFLASSSVSASSPSSAASPTTPAQFPQQPNTKQSGNSDQEHFPGLSSLSRSSRRREKVFQSLVNGILAEQKHKFHVLCGLERVRTTPQSLVEVAGTSGEVSLMVGRIVDRARRRRRAVVVVVWIFREKWPICRVEHAQWRRFVGCWGCVWKRRREDSAGSRTRRASDCWRSVDTNQFNAVDPDVDCEEHQGRDKESKNQEAEDHYDPVDGGAERGAGQTTAETVVFCLLEGDQSVSIWYS